MDDIDLPKKYDAIILGTGMTESIIAAALSRIGKSVLHLDCNDYYGENWASFNLENIESWIKDNTTTTTTTTATTTANNNNNTDKDNHDVEKVTDHNVKALTGENESFVAVKKESNITRISSNKYITKYKIDKTCLTNTNNENSSEGPDEQNEESNSENVALSINTVDEEMRKHSKRFNLDLSPKLLFSRGPMVELLISSNIAKYAEFKSFNRVLTWRKNKLESVPCSRADVFATKSVSVVQKRILIKILTLFAQYTENLDEFKGFEDKTFLDFLISKKVPDNLIHYILYAIAMGDENTSCLNGVKACKAFLESLGRYGNTPFIFPMYGSGELPQCFCRLCAVFGGIYCLKRGIDGLIIEGDRCTGVISDGVRLDADVIVISSCYNVAGYSVPKTRNVISRGIFITDRSILQSDKDPVTLLQFPPISQLVNNPVTVIELASSTNTCPENFYVVHLTTKASEEASSDLKFVIQSLFDIEEEPNVGKQPRPHILWSLTWNVNNENSYNCDSSILKNVKMCCGVDAEFDYELSINEARIIFHEFYPNDEFLPRAPDPDEIVMDSDTREDEHSANNTLKTDFEVEEKEPQPSEITSEASDEKTKESFLT